MAAAFKGSRVHPTKSNVVSSPHSNRFTKWEELRWLVPEPGWTGTEARPQQRLPADAVERDKGWAFCYRSISKSIQVYFDCLTTASEIMTHATILFAESPWSGRRLTQCQVHWWVHPCTHCTNQKLTQLSKDLLLWEVLRGWRRDCKNLFLTPVKKSYVLTVGPMGLLSISPQYE